MGEMGGEAGGKKGGKGADGRGIAIVVWNKLTSEIENPPFLLESLSSISRNTKLLELEVVLIL